MEQKALESQADTLAPGFVRALAGAPGTVSGRGLVAGLHARGKHSPVGRLWGHPEKPPPRVPPLAPPQGAQWAGILGEKPGGGVFLGAADGLRLASY